MATYLLKWNPEVWSWNDMTSDIARVRQKGFLDFTWTCGVTKRIQIGDRVFLSRTTVPPRGILGAGYVTRPSYLGYWDETSRSKRVWRVDLRWDCLLNPVSGEILPVERLDQPDLAAGPWHVQGGGKSVPPATAAILEQVWAAFLKEHGHSPMLLAEEVISPARFYEGAMRQVAVNVYERNSYARRVCIEHYGHRCVVCDFDFEAVYGDVGKGFIHVHHLIRLSEVAKEYEVDPIRDLRPVCPNCHAMIHAGKEMMSIEALRALIRKHAR